MKNFLVIFYVIFLAFDLKSIWAQQGIIELRSKYNSLEKFWVGTFEGGVTVPFTDFQKPDIGYTARVGIEYYFPSKIFFTPGLRLIGFYGELNGESNTGRLSGDGTLIRVIKKYNTPFVMIEPSVAIALGSGRSVPYFAIGLNYFLAFIPLERNSFSLYTNSKRNPYLTYSGEFGLRHFIHRDFTFNVAIKYFKGANDELDGFVSRKKDSFTTITTGISMHLFRKERIR